jgi:hypothetical protein
MHMERRYFIYLHERDAYDLHLFNEMLHSVSKHFVIDFDEEETLLTFLSTVEKDAFPHYIIVDLYEAQQVKAFITKLQSGKQFPDIPVLVLRDRGEDLPTYKKVEVFRRPRNSITWRALVQKLLE